MLDLRQVRFALAISLGMMTFMNDDYDDPLDKIIASSTPGDSQDGFVSLAQQFATTLAMFRSEAHVTPEYSEGAIYHVRAFLSSSPVEQPFRPFIAFALEDNTKRLFRYFGSVDGLEAHSSSSPFSRSMTFFREHEGDHGQTAEKMEDFGGLLSVMTERSLKRPSKRAELYLLRLLRVIGSHVSFSRYSRIQAH
jgi:hypothetical protein